MSDTYFAVTKRNKELKSILRPAHFITSRIFTPEYCDMLLAQQTRFNNGNFGLLSLGDVDRAEIDADKKMREPAKEMLEKNRIALVEKRKEWKREWEERERDKALQAAANIAHTLRLLAKKDEKDRVVVVADKRVRECEAAIAKAEAAIAKADKRLREENEARILGHRRGERPKKAKVIDSK